MITKITKQQQEYFDNLIEKYKKDITDFQEFEEIESLNAVKEMYKAMNQEEPLIIIGQNPFETSLLAALCCNKGSQLYSQLRLQLRSQLVNINKDWYLSLWWRYWECYYQFAKYIGVKFDVQKLNLFHNFLKHVYFCIPYKGICFISKPPVKVYYKDGKLHNDGASCTEFLSSIDTPTFEVWTLNGVRVPKYLAQTPAGALDIEFFKNEKNADIKAEFIRKYGIERMVDLGEVVDTWENHPATINFEWYKKSEYKLVDMSSIFTTYDYLPYLYMKNQTVQGVYHLECVYNPDDIYQPKTILEGLKVRLNGVDPETVSIKAIA